MKWRLMLAEPRGGAENMARDAGLMDRARDTGEAVLSVYSWERPTLSLGRNQTAVGKYDLDEIAKRDMDVVRRPTGGRALAAPPRSHVQRDRPNPAGRFAECKLPQD